MNIIKSIHDYVSLARKDIFLISYPKSGNTRFRLAVGRYLQLVEGADNVKMSFEVVNDLMPEFGRGNIAAIRKSHFSDKIFSNSGVIVKSHMPYKYAKFILKRNPVIFIKRNTQETLMSYFDYAKSRKIIDEDLSFSAFLRSSKFGVEAMLEFLIDWENNCLISITYEDLIRNDLNAIMACLRACEFEFDVDLMSKAIIETRRDKAVDFKNDKDSMKYKFAEEKSRNTHDYFEPEDIKYFNHVVKNSPIPTIKI